MVRAATQLLVYATNSVFGAHFLVFINLDFSGKGAYQKDVTLLSTFGQGV